MASVVITRKWTGSSLRKTSASWEYTEIFTVTGVGNKEAAVNAVIAAYPTHPDNPFMLIDNPTATNVGLNVYDVSTPFTINGRLGDDDPLLEPTEFRGDYETIPIGIDHDIDGAPIVNSAGDPYDPTPSGSLVAFVLVCERNIPAFSIVDGYNFTDAVNTNDFSLPGVGGVAPGNALCRYYKPVLPWRFGDRYVRVGAAIAFLPGQNPWDFHPKDKGRNSWYSDSGNKLGTIVKANGDDPNYDVLLDGTGKPLRSEFKVRKGAEIGSPTAAPIANPTAPTGLVIDASRSTADCKFLEWLTKNGQDFSFLPF